MTGEKNPWWYRLSPWIQPFLNPHSWTLDIPSTRQLSIFILPKPACNQESWWIYMYWDQDQTILTGSGKIHKQQESTWYRTWHTLPRPRWFLEDTTLGLESLSFPVIQWELSSRLSGKRNILDQSKERQQSLSVHRRMRSIFPQLFRYWVGMTVIYLGLLDWSSLPQNGTLKTSPEAKGHQSG